MELLCVSAQSVKDTAYGNKHPAPENFSMVYQSADLKLDNSWDLWSNAAGQAVISIRGTTENLNSWLENGYAAMVPAKGQIKLNPDHTFDYNFTEHPKAGVHVGWLVGTAILWQEMETKIDSMVKNDVRDLLVVGHSQGGGIAYLLTAHLHSLKKKGILPTDFQIKTYCSAAPKPGNLYFAYAYEAATINGWAFNVVNALDWVPEVPMSIQTLDDFNTTNPFSNVEEVINSQKPSNRIAMRYIYKKLDKPTRTAQQNYQKYLGEMTNKLIVKELPGLVVPPYLNSNNYVRTGIVIALTPDVEYEAFKPEQPELIFNHHLHDAYLFLAARMPTPFYADK